MAILRFLWLVLRPISIIGSAIGVWDVLNLVVLIAYPTIGGITPLEKLFKDADLAWFVGIPIILLLIAGSKLQRRVTNYERGRAVLKLSGPFQRNAEVDTNILPMWYIIVENTNKGTVAENVCVRMTNPDPPITMAFPIILHRLHDNNRPFEQRHNIRYGEPVTFDLFACGQINPDMFYLYRADGDEASQKSPEWMLSEDDNSVISAAGHRAEGWQFDVIATADPPASQASAIFCFRSTRLETI